MIYPIGKWIAAGFAEGINQAPYVLSALVHCLDNPLPTPEVIAMPFGRNPLSASPDIDYVGAFSLCKRRLKQLPSPDEPVDRVACVYSM